MRIDARHDAGNKSAYAVREETMSHATATSQGIEEPKYVLGATTREQERLLMQCKLLEPQARWMLEHIGVGRHWNTVDV
ncbi:MAG TPA: hypothetical protein VFO58_07195, partial [Vicinamibacterales bacterium]|nr:hypothetical protein [Vicinamibacterales bacterium]